jgi:hypothetical protein
MKLVPNTDLQNSSTIERHEGLSGHLPLNRIVAQLGYYIIIRQSFLFVKLRDVDCLKLFRVRHFARE